jgi:hypothetical protein
MGFIDNEWLETIIRKHGYENTLKIIIKYNRGNNMCGDLVPDAERLICVIRAKRVLNPIQKKRIKNLLRDAMCCNENIGDLI